VSRIVEWESIFDGVRIHFQGAKLHALFYRPIDNGEKIATRAVLLQLVLKDFVTAVFNPAFPYYDDFAIAGGADLGNAIGTRNGMRADRELLFLGAPANHAAKIISSSGRLRLTQRLYDALPEDLQEICKEIDAETYQLLPISQSELDALLTRYGIGWDREASAERVAEDKQRYPLSSIDYSSADTLIDIDSLSIHNNKRVQAASIFGDVSGFTKYIDAAETTEEQRTALRVLHAIRREMARVVKDDYNGLRVQYQGDRVQGLFHLPKDDAAAIATEVVNAAVGLQSSMEHTLKEILKPDADTLLLAVGIDTGTTLVTKLGTRAHRDRICLGEAVEEAARCEERSEGGQIGITKAVRDELADGLRSHFTYSNSAQCYIASNLTADKVERAARGAKLYKPGGSGYIHPTAAGIVITDREMPGASKFTPSRNYAPEG
jgi:class 3 adenylate cyclase